MVWLIPIYKLRIVDVFSARKSSIKDEWNECLLLWPQGSNIKEEKEREKKTSKCALSIFRWYIVMNNNHVCRIEMDSTKFRNSQHKIEFLVMENKNFNVQISNWNSIEIHIHVHRAHTYKNTYTDSYPSFRNSN